MYTNRKNVKNYFSCFSEVLWIFTENSLQAQDIFYVTATVAYKNSNEMVIPARSNMKTFGDQNVWIEILVEEVNYAKENIEDRRAGFRRLSRKK